MRSLALTLLCLLASGRDLRAQPEHAPSSQPVATRPAAHLDLLYTGRTGGVSSSWGTGATILLLWQYLSEHHGSSTFERTGRVLRSKRRLLLEPDRFRSAPVLQAIKSPGSEGGAPRILAEALPVLESEQVLIFQYPPDPNFALLPLIEEQNRRERKDPSLRRTRARLLERRTATGQRVLALELPDAPTAASASRDPLVWESWWGGRGLARLGERRGTYYLITKPRGVGAQRVRAVGDLRRALAPTAPLLVSPGGEVDTFDNARGGKSRYRDLDFGVLAALGYAAIVPSHNELYFGRQALETQARRHRLPLLATNLEHAAGKQKGAPVFKPYLLRRVGDLRVGIIGLVSPSVVSRVQDPGLLAGIRVTDPVEAAHRALNELRSLPATRPDLVVALSNLVDKEQTEFLSNAFGVDVFIGDFHRGGLYPPTEILEVADRRRDTLYHRSPLLEVRSASTRVGHIRAAFGRSDGTYHPLRLEHRQRVITSDLPRNEWVHRRMMALSRRDWGALESVIMPPLEAIAGGDAALLRRIRQDPEYLRTFPREQAERWQVWFTPRLWSNVVANILREASGAEAVLIKTITRMGYSTPGPILEEYVLSWASAEDPLMFYELSGAQLRQLAQSPLEEVTITGLDREGMRVGGRRIADAERYAVLLSKSVATAPALSRLLQGIEPVTRLKLEGTRLRSHRRGGTVRLREVVMATLRALRRGDPAFGAETRARLRTWLLPRGQELEPRWTLSAEEVTFSFANYGNYPRGGWTRYPGVRETRAATPNNYTLGLKGTLIAVYDSRRLAWDTRAAFDLARTVVNLEEIPGQNSIVVKAADDLQLSTELRLKFIDLTLGPRGRLNIIPYTNLTFDTEFTPTTNQLTGEAYPHQRDLLLSAGLVTFPGAILEEVRLAGVMRTDFASELGRIDGGLLCGFRLSLPLYLARLKLGATLRYFAPTGADSTEKLGLILQGLAKLLVPVTRDVSVSLGADLFLFRPKVLQGTDLVTSEPVQRGTAASLILSAGVAFDHRWKL